MYNRKLLKIVTYILFLNINFHSLSFAQKNKEIPAYYRYANEDGIKTISKQIPPEAYKLGYEVLDRFGNVIQVVEPPPSEEELEANIAIREQKKADEKLLKSFSSIKDAEYAMERQLGQLDNIIGINKGRILQLEINYDLDLKRAADYERKSQPVPDDIINRLEKLESEIGEINQFVSSKKLEKDDIKVKYDKIIERLTYLLNRR